MVNVGPLDRSRFVLGAVLVATAIFRFCPAYLLCGIRTYARGRA